MDLPIGGELIVELKSINRLQGIHEPQLLTAMNFADIKAGPLIDFNVTKLKDGIKRLVLRRLTFVLFAPFVVQLCLDRTVRCRMWNHGLDAAASSGSWAMVALPLGPGQPGRSSLKVASIRGTENITPDKLLAGVRVTAFRWLRPRRSATTDKQSFPQDRSESERSGINTCDRPVAL
jgi:hypothetical protein